MATRQLHAPRPHPRRWIAWLVVVLVLLAAYAIALRWLTLRVESGVAASIHPIAAETRPTPSE